MSPIIKIRKAPFRSTNQPYTIFAGLKYIPAAMIQTTPNFNGLSYCVHELILDSITAAVRVMSSRSLSEVTKRRSSFLFVNGCLPDQSIFGRQLVERQWEVVTFLFQTCWILWFSESKCFQPAYRIISKTENSAHIHL